MFGAAGTGLLGGGSLDRQMFLVSAVPFFSQEPNQRREPINVQK
jgi:hypothetical protein